MAHNTSNESDTSGNGWPSWDKMFASVSRIRLRGGVVGKISTVLIVVSLCIAAITWNAPENGWWLRLAGIAVIAALVFQLGNRMLTFAENNPYHATLEGAELLIHQQLQLGMKQQPSLDVDATLATSDPDAPPSSTDPALLNAPDETVSPKKSAEGTNAE